MPQDEVSDRDNNAATSGEAGSSAADLPPVRTDADLPPLRPVSSDPLAALRNALKYGVLGQILLSLVGLAVWWPLKGTPGIWGVVVGSCIGGGFVLITVVVVLATAKAPASKALIILMGSWFVKMLAVLVTLAIIKDMTFYDRGALVSMIIGAIVVVMGAEIWAVYRTRVPTVDMADS